MVYFSGMRQVAKAETAASYNWKTAHATTRTTPPAEALHFAREKADLGREFCSSQISLWNLFETCFNPTTTFSLLVFFVYIMFIYVSYVRNMFSLTWFFLDHGRFTWFLRWFLPISGFALVVLPAFPMLGGLWCGVLRWIYVNLEPVWNMSC